MPAPTTEERTLLDRLYETRAEKHEAWAKRATERAEVELAFDQRMQSDEDKPSEDEVRAHMDERVRHTAETDLLKAELVEFDARITDQLDVQRRRDEAAEAAKASTRVEITDEPHTYEQWKQRDHISYWLDRAVLAEGGGVPIPGVNRDEARKRLEQHEREMQIELPKRQRAIEARARKQMDDALGLQLTGLFDPFHRGPVPNTLEQRVEPNLSQGQGGYFVPPLWLVDDYIPGLRAHRVAATLPRQMDLPPGTDSINIPKLSTLTKVGYQQMNNTGLPSQDFTDTSVQANVKTIGGYVDIALQLLEQSPHQIIDEVITRDMMADYDKFLDGEVIAGDGTNAATLNGGHLTGLYPATNWSGTNTVTYTDASPAPYKFASVWGAMASQIAKNRFALENFALVMHGRRWFNYSTGLDANNRPLGETQTGGRFNIQAAIQAGLSPEGLVGTLPYLSDAPVYVDMNVPTTDSNGTPGGGTADVAISALWDDVWLFESDVRTEVFREVLSGSLGVRFRLYSYTTMLVRYGQSVAIGVGTGFAAPQGAVSSVLF